jgi:hypothetical protein
MTQDIRERLRSGAHNAELVSLGGVTHDKRCLEAADVINILAVGYISDAAVTETDTLNGYTGFPTREAKHRAILAGILNDEHRARSALSVLKGGE